MHRILLAALAVCPLLLVVPQSSAANLTEDEKKKVKKVIALMESALKDCLDVKMKSEWGQAAGTQVEYEKTGDKDSTIKDGLNKLRDMLDQERIVTGAAGRGATDPKAGTDADKILINKEFLDDLCGTDPKKKMFAKVALGATLINEMVHVYQKFTGADAVQCDAERDSDEASMKYMNEIVDAMTDVMGNPHATVAAINADAEKVAGLGDCFTDAGVPEADIPDVVKCSEERLNIYVTRLADTFFDHINDGTSWGKDYYGSSWTDKKLVPALKDKVDRDDTTMEDLEGAVTRSFQLPAGQLLTQSTAFENALGQVVLATTAITAGGNRIAHFWVDTDNDRLPELAVAQVMTFGTGLPASSTPIDSLQLYYFDGSDNPGLANTLFMLDTSVGQFLEVDLTPGGLPAGPAAVRISDSALFSSYFFDVFYSISPGMIRLTFSSVPNVMHFGDAPAVWFEMPVGGGPVIPFTSPGLTLAQARSPGGQRGAESLDGLAGEMISLTGNPLESAALESIGQGVQQSISDVVTFGPGGSGATILSRDVLGDDLYRVQSGGNQHIAFIPRVGVNIDCRMSDLTGDGAAERVHLSLSPPRLHLLMGNLASPPDVKQHVLEQALQSRDLSALFEMTPAAIQALRVDLTMLPLTRMPGLLTPAFFDDVRDYDNDTVADDAVLILRDTALGMWFLTPFFDVFTFASSGASIPLPPGFEPDQITPMNIDGANGLDVLISDFNGGATLCLLNDGSGSFSLGSCGMLGACCRAFSNCSIESSAGCAALGGTFFGAGSTCAVSCTCFTETEGNDSKAAANATSAIEDGDCIHGISTGSSTTIPGIASADYFKVTLALRPLGIYRHRLEYQSTTPTHIATIRGLTQTAGVPNAGTDAVAQTASTGTTPPRFIQWYGFGKGEMLHMRVTGVSTSTAPYVYTLSSQAVTPQHIGSYIGGEILLNWVGQGHTTDTDMWVYDGNLNAIAGFGNDDESAAGGGTGATLQSRLQRTYAAGTYYIAVSNFQLASNQPAPPDDDFRTGVLLDFPNAVVNNSTTLNANVTFTISDTASNSLQVTATRPGQFDVRWFTFTVLPPPPFGACCYSDGTCVEALSSTDCATSGGDYLGDGSDCSPNMCPQPGACCFPSAPCVILSASQCSAALGMYLGHGSNCSLCNCFMESEINESKATASATPAMNDGDCFTGSSTGTSTTIPGDGSADYFKVTLAFRPLGIYRHRLEYLAQTPLHTGSIQGLTQVAGAPQLGTDAVVQTGTALSNPPRIAQWYGFGKGEMFYFRVVGTPPAMSSYAYSLSSQAVAPQDIGDFAAGEITISTVGQTATDTDLWIYDSNLNAIPDFGNDDESVASGGTGTTLQSILRRTFAPGRYYLALTDYNLANNLGSPTDDDFRTGILLDFADLLVSSDRDVPGVDLDFTITDTGGTTNVAATATEGEYEVRWFQFDVGSGCQGSRGDANCSGGAPDFFDIDPFLLALFNLPSYQSLFCGGSICAADIDCSGAVDFFDIDSFLLCLFGTCPPCP